MELLFELHHAAFQSHIEMIWGWDEIWQQSNFQREFESSSTAVVEVAGQSRLADEQADKALHRDALHRAARAIIIQSPAGMRLVGAAAYRARGPGFYQFLSWPPSSASALELVFILNSTRMLPTGSRRRSKIAATTSMEASPWALRPRCTGDSTCAAPFYDHDARPAESPGEKTAICARMAPTPRLNAE